AKSARETVQEVAAAERHVRHGAEMALRPVIGKVRLPRRTTVRAIFEVNLAGAGSRPGVELQGEIVGDDDPNLAKQFAPRTRAFAARVHIRNAAIFELVVERAVSADHAGDLLRIGRNGSAHKYGAN